MPSRCREKASPASPVLASVKPSPGGIGASLTTACQRGLSDAELGSETVSCADGGWPTSLGPPSAEGEAGCTKGGPDGVGFPTGTRKAARAALRVTGGKR